MGEVLQVAPLFIQSSNNNDIRLKQSEEPLYQRMGRILYFIWENGNFLMEVRGGMERQKYEFVVAVFLLYFFYMLFGRLLDSHNETTDSQLLELERQLKNKIQRAKNLTSTLQSSSQNDDISFMTTVSGELVFPEFRTELNYNEEFWKTYLKNQLSFAMIRQLSEQTSELQDLVKQIETLQEDYFRLFKLKNRKKNRRLAVQIEKKFQCPYDKCYKFYGTDVSLNLHIKLKHNGGNKTDRQKLAVNLNQWKEEICLAEINKGPMPDLRLNLPPGYLEEYRRTNFMQKSRMEGQVEQ